MSRQPSIAEPSGGAPGVSPTEMVIASGTLAGDAIAGETVVVTGAGHAIGFEAARSLLWLGANVAIAEIDEAAGREAEARLAAEFAADRVLFLATDVANEDAVRALVAAAKTRFGRIDVVLNRYQGQV